MDKHSLLDIYQKMFQSRCFEEKSVQLNEEKKIVGSIHAGEGEEAVGVGIVSAMREEDILAPSYRDIAAVFAKGATLKELTGLLYAKQCAMSNGRTRILHVGDLNRGILPGNPILGASSAIGIGAALAANMDNTKKVVVNIMGDGASNEGAVHEAMNFAAVMKLPIVFVIVNNKYAWSTPTANHSCVNIMADRAHGYGMPGYVADGNDVLEVHECLAKCIEEARVGKGPSLVELRTYRWSGHSGNDKNVYRLKEEQIWHRQNDPILRLRNYLIAMQYFDEDQLSQWENTMKEEVMEAYRFAENDSDPRVEDVMKQSAMLYME